MGDTWVCSNFKVSHGLELQEIYTPILFKPLLLQANTILVIKSRIYIKYKIPLPSTLELTLLTA